MADAKTAASPLATSPNENMDCNIPLSNASRSKPDYNRLINSFGKDESEVEYPSNCRDDKVQLRRMNTENSNKIRKFEGRESRDLKSGYTAKPSNPGTINTSRSKSVHFLFLENYPSPRHQINLEALDSLEKSDIDSNIDCEELLKSNREFQEYIKLKQQELAKSKDL